MATTTVRDGRHVCLLPPIAYATPGAIEACDTCGRWWRYAEYGGFMGFDTNWVRMTRLRVRWIKRRTATLPADQPEGA